MATALVLAGAARLLTAAASVAASAAQQLKLPSDDRSEAARGPEPMAGPGLAGTSADATGPGPVGPVSDPTGVAVVEPPAAEPPAADEPSRSRMPESHIAELADRNARDVIAAVNGLSTDDLRALQEHESAHKQRKTVLEAIERAAQDHAG